MHGKVIVYMVRYGKVIHNMHDKVIVCMIRS